MLANGRPARLTALSRDDQVDAALLDNALRYDLWDDRLQSWAWDAQSTTMRGGRAL